MDYNIRRAILRRVIKFPSIKDWYNNLLKSKIYNTVQYSEYIAVRDNYLKKSIQNGYRWCWLCWCWHKATYEIFWYDWYYANWDRRLATYCLKSRSRLKKNILIMKKVKQRAIEKEQARVSKTNNIKYVKKKKKK